MRLREFAVWARGALGAELIAVGGQGGGSGLMARVLGVEEIGTGWPGREYGPVQARRLWLYWHARAAMGPWHGPTGTPGWVWEAMDRSETWEGGEGLCLLIYRGRDYTTLWRLRIEEAIRDRDGQGCLVMPWPSFPGEGT